MLADLVLPEDRAIWRQHQHTREPKEPEEIQFRIRSRDGKIRWIEHACQPVMDRQGRFQGYRVSNRDITRRKEAEEELMRHRERLEELVEERTDELARINSALWEEIGVRRQTEHELRTAKEAAEATKREEEARRQEAEQRRRIAEGLADVLGVLNSNRSLDEVLDFIAVQAGLLLGTTAAAIYSLESETGNLAVQATRGLVVTYVAGADIPIGQGVLQEAMASRQPVAVGDLYATPEREGDLGFGEGGEALVGFWSRVYRALLAVPIVVENEVYGGMLLYYAEPRIFAKEEVELAASFGEQVSLAIGNARLKDQVREAAAAAERGRLARDLHDAVTQTLFSASLIAEAMPRVWEQNPEQGRHGLEELRQLTQGAAAEMRTLLVELRPAALTEKSMGELLRHLTDAVMGRSRVPILLAVEGDCHLPADIQVAFYRIAQEALNNMAKYASAQNVFVGLSCWPDKVRLRVCDDGVGFDMQDILPDRRGLATMRERAEGIGARLEVDSAVGEGTRIRVIWKPGGGLDD
jgi:two-component system nitrate/nitrite sensor histidine kinase NarX